MAAAACAAPARAHSSFATASISTRKSGPADISGTVLMLMTDCEPADDTVETGRDQRMPGLGGYQPAEPLAEHKDWPDPQGASSRRFASAAAVRRDASHHHAATIMAESAD
jgi:hypothetical protein